MFSSTVYPKRIEKIACGWAALLKVKPPPKEKPKEQDKQEHKKPSD